MSSGFAADFKEQVRSRTDLVHLVGQTVALTPTRGGADFQGLCPFHDDHRPSFHVYPDRQSYRCWVCDAGGDCFTFVMQTESVGFREALEMLARRAGLEIPRENRPRRTDGDSRKPDLYDVTTWAALQFHRCLLNDPQAERARNYLFSRGFQPETIRTFQLGYHPDDWTWLQRQAGTQFTSEQLLQARLVGRKDETRHTYDYFVDRVMFPIRDAQGRVVAFGGRVLPDKADSDPRKYFNSPEGPLFAKSRLLYGFDTAKEAIRRSQTAVVMEGYTDCILTFQAGLQNCVGTLGTALTEDHVLALKRFARTVVLMYDGDEAGQRAAERALLKFLPLEVDLRILTLPESLDPADYVQRYGVERLQEEIERAAEAWDYKLQSTINRHGVHTIDSRQRILDEMVGLLAQVPRLAGNVRQDIILGNLAQRLLVDERTIRSRLTEARRRAGERRSAFQSVREAAPAADDVSAGRDAVRRQSVLERELLEMIFAAPDCVGRIRAAISPAEFRDQEYRQLLELCFRLAEHDVSPSYERISLELEDAQLKRLALDVDESARVKQIASKMNAGPQETGGALLEAAIDNFKSGREAASYEASKGKLVQRQGPSSGLDPNDSELLRLISDYHQKRATKKSLT